MGLVDIPLLPSLRHRYEGTDLISSPSDAELKQLTRTLEKAQAENERLKHYMKVTARVSVRDFNVLSLVFLLQERRCD